MLDISCQCNVINFLVLRNFPLNLQSPCMLLSLGRILRYSTITKFNFDGSYPEMFSKHVILRLLVLSLFRVEYNLLMVTVSIAVGWGSIGRYLSTSFLIIRIPSLQDMVKNAVQIYKVSSMKRILLVSQTPQSLVKWLLCFISVLTFLLSIRNKTLLLIPIGIALCWIFLVNAML